MEKQLENGTKVLVFNYISRLGRNLDYNHYVKGTIVDSEFDEVINYTILGEDGKKYFGNYKKHTFGNCIFMTEEDYISYLNSEDKLNKINSKKRVLWRYK